MVSDDDLKTLIAEFGPWATLSDVRIALLRRSVRKGLNLPESASESEVEAAMRTSLDALGVYCRGLKK